MKWKRMKRVEEDDAMNESPMRAIAKIWREDADFRAEVEADPKAALASRGLEIDGPADVRVVADTGDTVHFVFPSNPDAALQDGALDGVAAGQRIMYLGKPYPLNIFP